MHTRFTYIQLLVDHEGFLGGSNELEIFGNVNGFYTSCASATEVLAGVTYIVGEDFPNSTMATAIPINPYRFKLVAYEDDDERCVHHSGDDLLGSWPTGIYLSQYNYPFYTENPSHLRINATAQVP